MITLIHFSSLNFYSSPYLKAIVFLFLPFISFIPCFYNILFIKLLLIRHNYFNPYKLG